MNKTYLLAAVAAAVVAGHSMAYAQGTQGPAGNNPDRICVYDSGAVPPIGWRIVPAGTASSLPRGVATEGQDTQLNADGGCDTDSGTPVPVPATATPPASPQATPTVVAATPLATATVAPTDTPTAVPTDTPTVAPTATATVVPTSEPTPELPDCARDGCAPENPGPGK